MKEIIIASLIQDIARQIATVYEDQTLCTQYAWWCLEHITQQKKINLITQRSIALTGEQQAQLSQMLDQLITDKKPLQYILGSVPFCDIDILVKSPTLIPRPETEEWCSNLIDQLKKLDDQRLQILELCVGSGCIALALAQAFNHASILATDIADEALALAQKNAAHNNITNVSFIHSDVYTNIPTKHQFDIIVSNPPYISEDEWRLLEPSVKDWEDKRALVAPDDGFEIIKEIIAGAAARIKPNKDMASLGIPQLMIEIGYTQAKRTVQLMNDAGLIDICVYKDLEQKDRVVTARVK